jgi:sortase A
VQGISLYSLAYGPGHYPQTPLPGQKGTVGMACHRTGWGSPCININQMQVGDPIYLDTPAGRYTFRVTSPPKQIEKTDGWVLNGDPNSKDPYRLAITTCTPPHTSLHRMVIWADQITPAPGQKPPPVPA